MTAELTILLTATVTAGTAILFGTLGAIVTEKAGLNQLGVEGLMLIGALSGFITLTHTQNVFIAIIMSFLITALVSSIQAFISVTLKGNQVVCGLAMTMFGIGITALFGSSYVATVNKSFGAVAVPILNKIPIIGQALFNQNPMVYLSYAMIAFLWFFFTHTRWGLQVRTVGHNPAAADTSGINVHRVRFLSMMVGAGISGLGGAYLSIFYNPFWTENLTAGKGWIAVALVIFAGWSTNKAILGAYLFGGLTALQLYLQAKGIRVSANLLNMTPYICTIAVLVATALRKGYIAKTPNALGVPYDREDRN